MKVVLTTSYVFTMARGPSRVITQIVNVVRVNGREIKSF
jgi:hypothetical protein